MTDDENGGMERRNGGSRPVPDPTVLTDRAIERLERSMKQFVESELAIRDERLRGIDEATKLRLEGIDSVKGDIDQKVGRLRDIHEEQFRSVQLQFSERDIRVVREGEANTKAVGAAFDAQKESAAKEGEAFAKAIDKSEKATAETIKTNQELSRTTTDALTKSLDEVKLSLTRIESAKTGAVESRTESRLTTGALVSIVSAAVAVVAVAANFLR